MENATDDDDAHREGIETGLEKRRRSYGSRENWVRLHVECIPHHSVHHAPGAASIWGGGVACLNSSFSFTPYLGQGCNVVSAPLIYLRSSPVWCVCVCACLYRCCRQTVKRARESRDSSPGRITVTIRRARTNTSPWRRFCLRYARTVSHRSKWSRSRGLC